MRYLLAGADLALTVTVYTGGVADPDVLDGSDFAAVVRDRYGATTDTLTAAAGNGNGQIDVTGTAVGGYVNGPAWVHVSYLDSNGSPRTVERDERLPQRLLFSVRRDGRRAAESGRNARGAGCVDRWNAAVLPGGVT